MDCGQLTQPATALRILQSPADGRLAALFHCIYALFQSGFLDWITNKYAGNGNSEKLREDARDAFQNGLIAFYRKAQEAGFSIRGSLKTTIYSFGLLQLLAFLKKEAKVYNGLDCLHGLRPFFEDDLLADERHRLLNERELHLVEALNALPKKQRDILVLRYVEGLRSKEIAKQLGVSAGNVDNDAGKAYKTLRKLLSAKLSFKKEAWE